MPQFFCLLETNTKEKNWINLNYGFKWIDKYLVEYIEWFHVVSVHYSRPTLLYLLTIQTGHQSSKTCIYLPKIQQHNHIFIFKKANYKLEIDFLKRTVNEITDTTLTLELSTCSVTGFRSATFPHHKNSKIQHVLESLSSIKDATHSILITQPFYIIVHVLLKYKNDWKYKWRFYNF